MKYVVVSEVENNPHVGWLPVDEYATRIARYLNALIFYPSQSKPIIKSDLLSRLGYPLKDRGPDGDVLFVVARHSAGLNAIRRIRSARSRFKKIYGWVADSYFKEGYTDAVALYDAIAVTDHDDAEWVKARYKIPVHVVHQGVDTLAARPHIEIARSIDVIGFGRLPPSYHAHFVDRFHRTESKYLYLHSPIGNLTGPTIQAERTMLLKTLQRSRFALAFHMFCNPEMNRPKSMMVTTRWLESLAAGCIVVGKRPISRMADEMLSWSGSTTELPDAPHDAAIMLESMLESDEADFANQRKANVYNMLRHHDIRSRIADLFELFEIPAPQTLRADIARLEFEVASFPRCMTEQG